MFFNFAKNPNRWTFFNFETFSNSRTYLTNSWSFFQNKDFFFQTWVLFLSDSGTCFPNRWTFSNFVNFIQVSELICQIDELFVKLVIFFSISSFSFQIPELFYKWMNVFQFHNFLSNPWTYFLIDKVFSIVITLIKLATYLSINELF